MITYVLYLYIQEQNHVASELSGLCCKDSYSLVFAYALMLS